MGSRKFSVFVLIISIIVIFGTFLPYLYAAALSDDQFVFGGFLLNPTDGNSYLAKMYQGWRGDPGFTLPYTYQAGQAAYLFLLYLALGHLAKLVNAPLPLIFHIARFLSVLLMLLALYRFCASILPEARHRNLAFALCALGSGLGWLALPFGGFTSDFWVAEAYPFLSAYSNPHFPLGIALLLLILTPQSTVPADLQTRSSTRLGREWIILPVSLALSIVMPFGVVIACAVLAGVWIWYILDKRANNPGSLYLARLIWTAIGGLPLLAYAFWVTNIDPYLRAWNQQNQTPSPALWDLVISFFPLLLLAVLGAWRLLKNREGAEDGGRESWRIPLVWAVIALVLVYIPWNLQRRFLVGMFIPLAVLAPPGLEWLSGWGTRRYWFLSALVFLLVLPTNLLILLTARHAAVTHDPSVYIYRDEGRAFRWLTETSPPESVVLAAPETGLLIPAYTGLRVIYGHPFETVNASEEELAVKEVFAGKWDASELEAFLDERGIDYAFYGPRERSLGALPASPRLVPALQQGEVTIYTVQGRTGGMP